MTYCVLIHQLEALTLLQCSIIACRLGATGDQIQAHYPENYLPASISTNNTAAPQPDVIEPIPLSAWCSYELGFFTLSNLIRDEAP